MANQPGHDADSPPQSEAVTKPTPRADSSYFTQEVEYTRQAINEMRIEMNKHAADSKAEITKAVDAFIKNTIEVNSKTAILSAETKGQYATLDVSVKQLTKSIDEMKPKVDSLTSWRLLLIGGSTVIMALFSIFLTLWIKGVIKISWPI